MSWRRPQAAAAGSMLRTHVSEALGILQRLDVWPEQAHVSRSLLLGRLDGSCVPGCLCVCGLQAVATEKAGVAAQAKVECEALLVEIVVDKRSADEQEKQVCLEGGGVRR
jgi:hypothetical protein